MAVKVEIGGVHGLALESARSYHEASRQPAKAVAMGNTNGDNAEVTWERAILLIAAEGATHPQTLRQKDRVTD